MRHLKQLVLLAVLLVGIMSHSQKAETPDFVYNLEGNIDYMTLTNAGVLLIAHAKGLAGIKPGQEGLLFNFDDYGKVKQEELKLIPGTPYVMVSQTGFSGISAKQSVIDFVSGKRVFDTKSNGWKVAGVPTLLMPQNKLVVSGQRNAKEKYTQAIGIYNMETGKEEKLMKLKGSEAMTGTPKIINGRLIVSTYKRLYCIDLDTGAETWTLDLKNVAFVEAAEDGKSLYAFVGKGKNHEVHKVSDSGTKMWAEGKKLKGFVSNFEITPKGLAIVSDVADTGKKGLAKLGTAKAQSNISFLSASNGEDLWEKAPKTKGYVQHFYIMEDGILFGLQEGGINKISYEGTPLFKKPLKTGANIYTMALTKQGMIYITDSDANIINLDTGASIWSKPIKYKKAKYVISTYDAGHQRYLISTGNEMISINENTGAISTLANYKFEGKENPTGLTVRDKGLLLSSEQNIMMLNFDGSEQFKAYYRAPGKSAFAVVVLGALTLASTAAAMSAEVRAGANKNYLGQYNAYGKRMKHTADAFAAIGTASFNEMAKRFKATSATENARFILTKRDEGVGLVKVNKDTGNVENEIILKDKKPEYKVDDFGGYLYYIAKRSVVYAYDLKK